MLIPFQLSSSNFFETSLNRFYLNKVQERKVLVSSTLKQVLKIVMNLLKEVELLEPRFSCSILENEKCLKDHTYYKGLNVISPTEFEITIYLNQMGVFNLIEDTKIPGYVALKLFGGSKRSMSLWVEFITASGYLSARKIRSRFQFIISKVCQNKNFDNIILIEDSNKIKLKIMDSFHVIITPAFRYNSNWPKCASFWSKSTCNWPPYFIVEQVVKEGFDLCSKEVKNDTKTLNDSEQNQLKGDCWMLSFSQAEDQILMDKQRKKCLSILKTLRDRNLILPDNPITNYHLKTLLLFECEKHCLDENWIEPCLTYRINGILLQLVSCLQQRYCPHYFMPQKNLFKGKSIESLELAARKTWALIRQLLTNPSSLDLL